jgi:hypothetical protein
MSLYNIIKYIQEMQEGPKKRINQSVGSMFRTKHNQLFHVEQSIMGRENIDMNECSFSGYLLCWVNDLVYISTYVDNLLIIFFFYPDKHSI